MQRDGARSGNAATDRLRPCVIAETAARARVTQSPAALVQRTDGASAEAASAITAGVAGDACNARSSAAARWCADNGFLRTSLAPASSARRTTAVLR